MKDVHELLAQLTDKAVDFIGIAGLDGRGWWVSDRGCALVALEPSAVQGTFIADCLSPRDRPLARMVLEEAGRHGQATAFLDFQRFDDGRLIPMVWDVFRLDDREGKPVAWATFSHTMGSAYVDRLTGKGEGAASTTGRHVLDLRDGRVRLDQAAASLVGISDTAWSGTLEEVLDHMQPERLLTGAVPRDSAELVTDVRRNAEGGVPRDTVVRVLDAPEPRWIRFTSASLARNLYGGVMVDVTEAERAHWLLQALVEGLAPDTVGAVDDHMRYIAINSASRASLQAMYGREYEVGDLVTDGQSPEMAEVSAQVWRRALTGESWVDELTFGDREQRTFRSRFYPLRDGAGSILGAAGWGTDVTDAVNTRRSLEEANEALEQFVRTASHDLRSPLRGVSGLAMLARHALDDGDTERIREMLGRIDNQIAGMDQLLRDLLHWAEVRKVAMPAEEVAVADLVDVVEKRLEPMLAERSATLDRGVLGTVTGDRTMLMELLANLVENGLKYNTSETPVVKIDQVDGENPAIEVSDNGIGIEPEHTDQVFEFFKRLHGPQAYGGGTGAGLALVREIAHRHGGEVTVTSTPGEGSTFRVRLPTLHPPTG